ncbi:hypothetical protein HNQ91_001019 [Filimonas zeae]|uniref:TonB-dependent receptor n=1 Tax=Filimonas zeae TaxID=1737353 RepID=A0A917MSM8_9BACT|nr:outer membrane beta-barrel family protein [Filimonas zeae]MDR6337997.1 hypothetical protein [Filimonas zeae]GGH61220.1 TonB-dependent receptor [Filimonas zeae]
MKTMLSCLTILSCLSVVSSSAQTDTTAGAVKNDTTLVLTARKVLPDVVVTGRKNALTLLPDKKVFEMGKDILSQNGSVTDVLNGIPAVNVSPQGQVTLRGNAGVTILINGRRSGLAQGNMLEQLQAAQVERIEVITSPSARYDAAGASGIINIILKKNSKAGFNGQVQAMAGIPNDTRLNASINYKSDKFNFFATPGLRKSDYRGLYTSEQTTPATALSVQQRENRHDDGRMLYTGMDYRINDKQSMTAAYLWHGTDDHDKTWLDYDYHHTITDSVLNRTGESWEHRNYHQLEYNYTQLFTQANRKWTVDVQYDWWNSHKEWQLFTGKSFPVTGAYPALSTHNYNTSRDLLVQTDWVQPLNANTRLEAGVKTEARSIRYDFLAQQEQGGTHVVYEHMDNGIRYQEYIQGGYVQGSYKKDKWSYLAGARLEYADIRLQSRGEAHTQKKDYLRIFPTLHIDYSVNEKLTVQAHYSSRIRRPSLWDLSPFAELTDITTRYAGNPQLNPAYTSLIELGLLKRSNTLTLNPALFYQHTTTPFTDYTTRNTNGVFITMPVNISGESRLGAEMTVMYSPFAALQLNADVNLYRYRQWGQYNGFDYAFSGTTSGGRVTAQWKLPHNLGIQGRYYYTGANATAQSRVKTIQWADFGISKKLLNDRIAVAVDATNVFDTRRNYTQLTRADYSLTTMSRFNGARFRMSVTWKITKETQVRQAKAGNRS